MITETSEAFQKFKLFKALVETVTQKKIKVFERIQELLQGLKNCKGEDNIIYCPTKWFYIVEKTVGNVIRSMMSARSVSTRF